VWITNYTGYDAQGRVIWTVDGLGKTNYTFYNSLGKVEYTVDKFGNTNFFSYDARGNIIQTLYPDGTFTRTAYDNEGRVILTTDRNGITGTRNWYDALGRITNAVRVLYPRIEITTTGASPQAVIVSDGTPVSSNITVYHDNGWVKCRIGPDGQPTWYDYYPDGRTRAVTNALNQRTFYAYDAAARQQYVVDALNRTNWFEYDAAGRLIRTVYPDGTCVSNAYNLNGQRVTLVDQLQRSTEYTYTPAGQLSSVTQPAVPDPESGYTQVRPIWSYQYDELGNLAVIVDAKGRATTNWYDALSRLYKQRLPLGQVCSNVYDSRGLLWKQYDFKGQYVEYRYDRYGRVTNKYYFAAGQIWYPSNSVSYEYDTVGRVRRTTERWGQAAATGYAVLWADSDQLIASGPLGAAPRMLNTLVAWLNDTDPATLGGLAGCTLAGLTLIGLLLQPTARGRLIVLRALPVVGQVCTRKLRTVAWRHGRVRMPGLFWRAVTVVTIVCFLGSDPHIGTVMQLKAQSPPAFTLPTERVTEFGYDPEGRLVRVSTPEGEIRYQYDLATGRHIRTCTANTEVEYRYDELGRLQTVKVLKRNGQTLSQPEITTYSYDPVGNRWIVQLPNGVTTRYQYDSLNRLTNLTHTASSDVLLASYSYRLDLTGRRTNAVEVIRIPNDEGGGYITNVFSWSYDALYRLTNEVCISSVAGGSYTNVFEYDLVGNRLKEVRYRPGSVTTITNLYNGNDWLLREVQLVNGVPVATNMYAYDANGSVVARTNITASGVSATLFGYDLKNKLSWVSEAGSGQTNYFIYNDSGVRVQTWSSAGSGTLYLVDPNNHTGYAQVLEEYGVSSGAVTLIRSYVIGDDVIAQASGFEAEARYFLYDGHGSTRQLVDGNGVPTVRFAYEAYGLVNQAISSCSAEQAVTQGITRLLYCGEQYEPLLRMYNLRARFYDPGTGRFNARDTFLGNNFDPQSLHKYAYCHCDPVNGTDPSGKHSLAEISIVSAIVGALAALVIPTITYLISRNWYNDREWGTLIHNMLCLYYDYFYAFTGGIVTNKSVAGKKDPSRPDIRFTGLAVLPWKGEVYEIKKEGNLSEGLADLAFYICSLYTFYPTVPWRPGVAAPPPSTLPIPGFSFLKVNFRLAAPGVILYKLGPEWNNLGYLAALSFVSTFATTFTLEGGFALWQEIAPWVRPVPVPAPA